MGAVVGLLFGAGVVLILSAWSPRRSGTGGSWRQDRRGALLSEAGLAPDRAPLVRVVVLSGSVGVFACVLALTGVVPVAFAFGGIAALVPSAVLRGRARRRHRELAAVWPDAVDDLASAVRAGMSLGEALSALGQRGPESLRPAFEAFARDLQVGAPFVEALDRLKARLADPVGDRVVEALRVAREVGGGDLGRLLRNLSGYLRDQARTRAELEARQAWAVNGARLAVAAPWLVLFLLCFQQEVIARYSSPAGVVVLGGGAAASLVAYAAMLRIGRLPSERRVLA